jgi:hypothetical protein
VLDVHRALARSDLKVFGENWDVYPEGRSRYVLAISAVTNRNLVRVYLALEGHIATMAFSVYVHPGLLVSTGLALR